MATQPFCWTNRPVIQLYIYIGKLGSAVPHLLRLGGGVFCGKFSDTFREIIWHYFEISPHQKCKRHNFQNKIKKIKIQL